MRSESRRAPATLVAVALVIATGSSSAQAPASAAPMPYPYAQPPPYYAPPPGYPPPPYYAPVPVAPAAPERPYVIHDWDPDVPAPSGYRMVEEMNGKLVGVGVGLLAFGWVTSIFTAIIATSAEKNDPETGGGGVTADDWTPLYIPVAGPFIALGSLEPKPSGTGLLIADGVLQGAGALAIVIGVLDESHKLVRTDVARRVEIAPAVGVGLTGLHARGIF